MEGFEQDFIPVNGIGLRGAQTGKQNASGFRLAADFLLILRGPVCVFPVIAHIFFNTQGTCGAQIHTAVAGNAAVRIGKYHFAVIAEKVAFI